MHFMRTNITTIVNANLPNRIPDNTAPIATINNVSSIRLCESPIIDNDKNESFLLKRPDFASFIMSPPPYENSQKFKCRF